LIVENAWVQKVDEKLTITASDEINLSQLHKDARKANINWGIQATYKL
jgi:hypothetical protein